MHKLNDKNVFVSLNWSRTHGVQEDALERILIAVIPNKILNLDMH